MTITSDLAAIKAAEAKAILAEQTAVAQIKTAPAGRYVKIAAVALFVLGAVVGHVI
ncbi:hypothetical protein [Novosphingobium sp. 9]|uniref:hypothetical protein n=1 Tax=Novosphingobium sp. 9 TaxID=2025349 RepID=UPI0021B58231|nr:hypothetical protein [Novosphingobium sp. 9]